MSRRRLTRFGIQVMSVLADRQIPLWQLAEMVEAKTGRFVTTEYLRNCLHGVPTPWYVMKAIREILNLRG